MCVEKGDGRRKLKPPYLDGNPFHMGNISTRTIGNLGNLSDSSPDLYDLSNRNCTSPLNLKSCCVHESEACHH